MFFSVCGFGSFWCCMRYNLKHNLGIVAAIFGLVSSTVLGFLFFEERYANKQNTETSVEEAIKIAELNDSINYFVTNNKILSSEVERLKSTIEMYMAKMVSQGGKLSPADEQRVRSLEATLIEKNREITQTQSAIDAIRLNLPRR